VTFAELEHYSEELKQGLAKTQKERDEYKKLCDRLLEENARLKRGLFGRKAERLAPSEQQLSLAVLGLALGGSADAAPTPAEQTPDATQVIAAHERRTPRRNAFPQDLPRVEIELVPAEVQREGLDAFDVIGEERRETIERRPSSAVVVVTVRPKFVRKTDKGREGASIVVAEPAELPILKGSAGPGMLADTIVRRWQDHLPLHRLESIYGREGLSLSRSTLCGWHDQLAELCEPVIDAMWRDAFAQPYLCVDATGVLVLQKEKCRRGYFWVLIAPGKHALFRFSASHDRKTTDALLGGYKGYLVADAHAVYDHLFAAGDLIEVGCWSHGRRYFFFALASDPERAKKALALIGALFHIERSIADEPRKRREAIRQSKSRPIVEQFFHWCELERDLVLDQSPISKAIGYVLNQRQALCRFLDDGRLPLTNNISERNLRREAIGRKNWMFVGSEDGARANAIFTSLLASCQMHALEPWAYLRDLLCLLPRWPKTRVLDLAPAYFQHTAQQRETRQLLAANPFRNVILGAGEHAIVSTS